MQYLCIKPTGHGLCWEDRAQALLGEKGEGEGVRQIASIGVGIAGLITIIYGARVYGSPTYWDSFWGDSIGHRGPLWAIGAGLLLLLVLVQVRTNIVQGFYLCVAGSVVAAAGGYDTGWGFLVVPLIAGFVGCFLLTRHAPTEPSPVPLVERWFTLDE